MKEVLNPLEQNCLTMFFTRLEDFKSTQRFTDIETFVDNVFMGDLRGDCLQEISTRKKAVNWLVTFWDYLDEEFDNYLCETEDYEFENPFRDTEAFVLRIVIQIVNEKLRDNFAGAEWLNFKLTESKLEEIKRMYCK